MSDDFKVLDDRSHVILRPGMYLGTVVCEPYSAVIDCMYQTKNIVPALIKMVDEAYTNSIDEFVRTSGKFATNISIDIVDTIEGTQIVVSDDGRGIPLDTINGSPRALLAWTSLRAGSNFDDSKRVGAGTNGVGISLVNIFSSSFVGNSCDGNNKITVTCSDNMLNTSFKMTKSHVRGTTVSFIPDLSKFGIMEFDRDHIDVIRDRVNNLAIMYPQIQFSFCGEKIRFKNIKQIAKKFHEYAIAYTQDNISMVFAPSGTQEEFRILSYVNGVHIKNGGAHVDFIMNKVIENLREHIKKKLKIDVLPNQIRQHLLFASWISNFPALKFDSQTKERVTNSIADISAYMGDIDFDKISKSILNTPAIVDPMIASILYKKELAERLELAKKKKELKKTRIVNHIAATDSNPENKTLLICEGASAIGSLINVRNPKTTGGYPVRGKPLNVRGLKATEIMKNKEIAELLSIIGLEIGQEATDLNYGKICVFSDRDLDGEHIFGLLLNLFSLWPELFYQGRIYRMISPLYLCTKGKQTKMFYSDAEFGKFDSTGWNVDRFKGLGTMPEDIYSECVNNPKMEQIKVNSQDDLDKLQMAFGDDASLRKEWMVK